MTASIGPLQPLRPVGNHGQAADSLAKGLPQITGLTHVVLRFTHRNSCRPTGDGLGRGGDQISKRYGSLIDRIRCWRVDNNGYKSFLSFYFRLKAGRPPYNHPHFFLDA